MIIPKSKTNNDIAREVIKGKWDNGDARIRLLTNAGNNSEIIREEVNNILKARTEHLKTNEVIAKEVIQGKWNNGNKRKELLVAAGYDYYEIQSLANKLI